jgi:hypothetical protein
VGSCAHEDCVDRANLLNLVRGYLQLARAAASWILDNVLGSATIQFLHVRSSLYTVSQWLKSRFLRPEYAVEARWIVEIPANYQCLREISRSKSIISPR